MTIADIQSTIDALDDLLEQERQALLSGDLEALSSLHENKTKLIERLNGLDVKDQERLVVLRDKVGRNQDLLNSALEGIRAVSRRLAAVRRVRNNLETYDSKGQKSAIVTQTEQALEKRA